MQSSTGKNTLHFSRPKQLNSNVASWETLLDPQEKTSYVELFQTADTENKGVLLKDEAMDFFKKSNIPNNILGEASIEQPLLL